MKRVTDRQKEAVRACEEYVAGAEFKGDINNYADVSDFLSRFYWRLTSNTWAITNGYD